MKQCQKYRLSELYPYCENHSVKCPGHVSSKKLMALDSCEDEAKQEPLAEPRVHDFCIPRSRRIREINAPDVAFPQRDQCTCFPMSIASALYHMGFMREGHYLEKKSRQLIEVEAHCIPAAVIEFICTHKQQTTIVTFQNYKVSSWL